VIRRGGTIKVVAKHERHGEGAQRDEQYRVRSFAVGVEGQDEEQRRQDETGPVDDRLRPARLCEFDATDMVVSPDIPLLYH
jgi:hypothetical protein